MSEELPYKKRDPSRSNDRAGTKSIQSFKAEVEQLKDLKDSSKDHHHMTEAAKKKKLETLPKLIENQFASAHHLYFLLNIDGIDDFNIVMSDRNKLGNFTRLLRTATPPTYATQIIFMEDAERKNLANMLTIDEMYHLDDVDFFVDELITKYGRNFRFEGNDDAFLNSINDKWMERVSNLELQYLRQVRRVITKKHHKDADDERAMQKAFEGFKSRGLPKDTK